MPEARVLRTQKAGSPVSGNLRYHVGGGGGAARAHYLPPPGAALPPPRALGGITPPR